MRGPTYGVDLQHTLLFLLLLVVAGGVVSQCKGYAQDAPEHLTVAQVCYLEASFSQLDCAGFVGVARARAKWSGRPWVEQLRRYSALDAKNARAAAVRAFPAGDVPGQSPRFQRRWRALLELATSAVQGRLRDPCKASHWGSTTIARDRERARRAVSEGRWVLAVCAGKTSNAFYRGL